MNLSLVVLQLNKIIYVFKQKKKKTEFKISLSKNTTKLFNTICQCVTS